MTNPIAGFFRELFFPSPRVSKMHPQDLEQFEVARKRLHQTSRQLAREADAFGDMVRNMRGTSGTKTKKTKS